MASGGKKRRRLFGSFIQSERICLQCLWPKDVRQTHLQYRIGYRYWQISVSIYQIIRISVKDHIGASLFGWSQHISHGNTKSVLAEVQYIAS